MGLDVNRKAITKNAYRMTKVRGKTALRVRVPGGHLDAKYFDILKDIAQNYGDGSVHLTTRQGFEIPGIDYEKIPEINKKIRPILEGLEVAIGVDINEPNLGYPAAGTRNISACIGNRVCGFASYDTTGLALKLEEAIYPNNYHVKIALTGCPNDCIKARMQDFGVIGMAEPEYEYDGCIGCEACVKNCKSRVTGALTVHNGKIRRDSKRCIGCGECVLKCPTAAWKRNTKKFFNLIIMGRTGKKNPRMAMSFIQWADESVVISVIKNTYPYVDKYIDRTLPKEHVGYIVDRTGYPVFRDWVLKGVKLNKEAVVAKHISFGGTYYEKDAFMGPYLES